MSAVNQEQPGFTLLETILAISVGMVGLLGLLATLEIARKGQRSTEAASTLDAFRRDAKDALLRQESCTQALGPALTGDATVSMTVQSSLPSLRLPFHTPAEVTVGTPLLNQQFTLAGLHLIPREAVEGATGQRWATLFLELHKSTGNAQNSFGTQSKALELNLILVDSNANGFADSCIGAATANVFASPSPSPSLDTETDQYVMLNPLNLRPRTDSLGNAQWSYQQPASPSGTAADAQSGWVARVDGATLEYPIEFEGRIKSMYVVGRNQVAGQPIDVSIRRTTYAAGTPYFSVTSSLVGASNFQLDYGSNMQGKLVSFVGLVDVGHVGNANQLTTLRIESTNSGDQIFSLWIRLQCSKDPSAVPSYSTPPPCGRLP